MTLTIFQIVIARSQMLISRAQVRLSEKQEVIVANQLAISAAQAKTDIRSALSAVMRFADPGVGKRFSLMLAPVADLTLDMSRDDLLARVAVAYPNGVDDFARLLEALDRYRDAAAALPQSKREKKDGEPLWLPNHAAGPDYELDDAANRYLAAINDVLAAAEVVRSHYAFAEVVPYD